MTRRSAILLFLAGLFAWSTAHASQTWQITGFLESGRRSHTATLLRSGHVLVAGGYAGDSLASAEIFDPRTGTWRNTGSMSQVRMDHSATLLPSGKVLVTGGSGALNPTRSAELYDPETGTWTPTGDLLIRRSDHTATLLRSGKVLVIGGTVGIPSSLSQAEIYDPATGTWSDTQRLVTPRSCHTATLLRSGKVLVTGGGEAGIDAEVFDPQTETWQLTGSLAAERCDHTATLLPTGRVLVTGGWYDGWNNVSGSLAGAEIYNPDTGRWQPTGSLATPRHFHTATLLPSGQVLVTGGIWSPAEPVVEQIHASAELYDPSTGSWRTTGAFTTRRQQHSATLLATGRVLVAGGRQPATLSSAEIYDPIDVNAHRWTPVGSMSTPRLFHSSTLLSSGQVLVAGGNVGIHLSSAETYDTETGVWQLTGDLAAPRSAHEAVSLPNGEVLVAGGENDGGYPSVTEVYDPETRTWSIAGSLAVARIWHTMTRLTSGRVLVAGGGNFSLANAHLASAEIFDPQTRSWTATAALATPRYYHTATLLLSGKVLVAGGFNGADLATAEIYDPETATWQRTGSLATPRSEHFAALLPSGRVLVGGGRNGTSLRSAEVYDPRTGQWTTTGSHVGERIQATAGLTPSGRVFVTDGAGAEIYDPPTGTWHLVGGGPLENQSFAEATYLPTGEVLISGGFSNDFVATAQTYRPPEPPAARRPVVRSASPAMRYGQPVVITGERFRGDSEASGGHTGSAAVNYPLVHLRSRDGRHHAWLEPDAQTTFADDPMTLTVSRLPDGLEPGLFLLTAITAGVPSAPWPVELECSIAIVEPPTDRIAALGSVVTFTVTAQGASRFQWQRNGVDIPGATGPSYTTPPAIAADDGTVYGVRVANDCTEQTSGVAAFRVEDDVAPTARLLRPNGGEYWVLDSETVELVTWEMSDNIRVCRVDVALFYSDDGGVTYQEAPGGGGLPATLGPGGACTHSEQVDTTSLAYALPAEFPSGRAGSLYKVRLAVTDQAGNVSSAESENPFFFVRPNPDTVKNLLLTHVPRMRRVMGVDEAQAAELSARLRDLANHPRVQGLVVSLDGVTGLADLYAAWDADPGNPDRANQVLFGCPVPLPAGCPEEKDGVHDLLRDLLAVYSGVESIVLVGDDRIVPMARIQDRTVLLPEQSYPGPEGGDLTADGTTVGQALAANKYLSDDALAVLDPVRPDELGASLFIPDLAIGRLVETPSEIITTLATYISQDGVLDLSRPDPVFGHKVQVTGYDFLLDSAVRIRQRWKQAFAQLTLPNSLAPVDGELIGQSWDEIDLARHLCGNGGDAYGLVSLNGHAVHYAEGIPGIDPFDIGGLATVDLTAADVCGSGPLDLSGSVLYAVGCHGGLPVAGSDPSDADNSLDLPQSFLSRGAVVYAANSGYGWGLKHGIGYSERLVELFSEEMSRGGAIQVGEAVRTAKLRYYLEAPRFDPYDEKTLMQWTLFGLPMYTVDTGLTTGKGLATGKGLGPAALDDATLEPDERSGVETLGPVRVERRLEESRAAAKNAPPAFLTRLLIHFDLTAPDVYTKYNASGEIVSGVSGCPEPADGEPAGCYYTLNGLVERSTGTADLPVQPYLVYDSRLSGTSQHGVLWTGGEYQVETPWVPVFAELMSNGGDGSNHGVAPRHLRSKPNGPRAVPGNDPPGCRPSDTEVNSMVVVTGEVAKAQDSETAYSVLQLHRNVDLEVFYFNDLVDASRNCDRQGPRLEDGPFGGEYHRRLGSTLEWAVPASDEAGVWRVVVIYSDGTVDTRGRGRWVPLELTHDAGVWRGELTSLGTGRLTYMVQAVDRRGNVSWLDYTSASPPSSGAALGLPNPVDVPLGILANARFDDDLAGWLLAVPPSAEIVHSTDDMHQAETSGSAHVRLLGAAETAAISQCFGGNQGQVLSFGGGARIDGSDATEPTVFALLEAFESADCSGAPLAGAATSSLIGDTAGFWQIVAGTLDVPDGAGSLLISFVVRAGATDGSDVRFDGVFLEAAFFADGFESGDDSRWSGRAP